MQLKKNVILQRNGAATAAGPAAHLPRILGSPGCGDGMMHGSKVVTSSSSYHTPRSLSGAGSGLRDRVGFRLRLKVKYLLEARA